MADEEDPYAQVAKAALKLKGVESSGKKWVFLEVNKKD